LIHSHWASIPSIPGEYTQGTHEDAHQMPVW
jgi:hypothetical protein